MAPSPLVFLSLLALFCHATPCSLAFVHQSTLRDIINLRTTSRVSASVYVASKATMWLAVRGEGQHGNPSAKTAVAARAISSEVDAAQGQTAGGSGFNLLGSLPASAAAADTAAATLSRGGFLASVAATTATVLLLPEGAKANGMLEFPPARLNNRYFLMRAGQGGSDKEGRVQSHPIDKLHMDNGLTEQGVEQAQRAAGVLAGLGVSDAFIWADISSRAQDTARILAQELNIRQDRVVPEYSFLEPRGMGIYDGKDVARVLPEVYKEDAISVAWRPPPNTDGTPNESVDDVFVRVRQLMSKLETQYQGEDLIIIGADSDCLSVLQSFVLGEDMGKHSKYYLRPGEGRQLRTSVDTQVGYRARREAKGNAVAANNGGGFGGEGA